MRVYLVITDVPKPSSEDSLIPLNLRKTIVNAITARYASVFPPPVATQRRSHVDLSDEFELYMDSIVKRKYAI